jgi:hypothetical protein
VGNKVGGCIKMRTSIKHSPTTSLLENPCAPGSTKGARCPWEKEYEIVSSLVGTACVQGGVNHIKPHRVDQRTFHNHKGLFEKDPTAVNTLVISVVIHVDIQECD